MNNLILDKNNFGQILDKLYYLIKDNRTLVINYDLIDDNKIDTKSFLLKIKKNPIKSNINPLNFQRNVRNEWK